MSVTLNDTVNGKQDVTLAIVLDGYNAPVSAGSFMDLVKKGFYNGMDVQRSDGFVIQTGDPEGPEEGYVDPKTNAIRRRVPPPLRPPPPSPFDVATRGAHNRSLRPAIASFYPHFFLSLC